MASKRLVHVGDLPLGGNNPILIQTMANIKTSKVDEVLDLIEDCKKMGNNLMRLSVLDDDDCEAFKYLSTHTDVPLIADIHFDHTFAIRAMENGAKAIRINPGNLGGESQLREVIYVAKKNNVPIRIGVNSGSILQDYAHLNKLDAMLGSLDLYVKMMEAYDFHDLVLSLKSSDPRLTLEAYRKANEIYPYPLHIGLTEAGAGYIGAIKSSVCLVPLLSQGIGDTIRISLTEPPQDEVICCRNLLQSLGLINNYPTLISCPTCGRTQVDLFNLYQQVEKYLRYVKKPLKVALMGCPVNGPGEAKDADIGLAGGKSSFLLFKKGKAIKVVKQEEALQALIDEIEKM